jgi:excisionase family DNA binding protein
MKNSKVTDAQKPKLPLQALTIRNAAERLQVSERTVSRLIVSGELKAIHIGRSVRITEGALQNLLTSADTECGWCNGPPLSGH